MNKRNVAIGLILFVVTAAIFYATFAKKRSESGAKVRAVTAERKDITSRVLAQGTLRAKRQVEVASEITGRVKTIFVKEGEQVEKGAPLYEIDDVEYRNAVKQLQVGLKAAKANRARANLMRQEAERQRVQNQKLKDKGLLSGDLYTASVSRVALADADVRATRAQIEQAQLELARAGDALLKAKVKAPLAGTVVSVPIEVGQVLTAGLSSTGGGFMAPSISQAVVVADLSELVAKLTVDELDIGNVEKDKSCTLQTQGQDAEKIPGKVSKVGLLGREVGGAVQFTVEALVLPEPLDTKASKDPKPKKQVLRSGMSVTAQIEVERAPNVVVVPITAVLEGDGKQKPDRVFVIEGSVGTTVSEREVTLGPSEDDLIAVLNGLKAGEKIVEGPFRALRALDDGDPVDIEEEVPLPGDEKASDKKAGKKNENND